ncbi:MAG: phosphatidylglycerophosphatase A [Alphaproteobacteria bacterium]|nr:phosphatidylglycerophosphatase A [Alphaproteobacteria bacterium]
MIEANRRALARSHPAFWLSTWFGAGLLPVAPGTWGSAAALPFAWAIQTAGGWPALLAATVAVFLIGWWAAGVYVRVGGVDDPGSIVIDEVAGQWLVLLPAFPDPLLYAVGFLLFRALDIFKPWPARWADRYVKGGLGVMLDDCLAAVYGMVAMAFLAAWWAA